MQGGPHKGYHYPTHAIVIRIQSVHVKKIDTQLNKTMLIISGTLKSTTLHLGCPL